MRTRARLQCEHRCRFAGGHHRGASRQGFRAHGETPECGHTRSGEAGASRRGSPARQSAPRLLQAPWGWAICAGARWLLVGVSCCHGDLSATHFKLLQPWPQRHHGWSRGSGAGGLVPGALCPLSFRVSLPACPTGGVPPRVLAPPEKPRACSGRPSAVQSSARGGVWAARGAGLGPPCHPRARPGLLPGSPSLSPAAGGGPRQGARKWVQTPLIQGTPPRFAIVTPTGLYGFLKL